MINDDDFVTSNVSPYLTPNNIKQLNEQRLNERLAVEASDYLLVDDLFRNINDDTPINTKINVISEKMKKGTGVKDQIVIERHNHPLDKRSRFTDNFKKDKLLAIKIGSMIDRIDEVEDEYYELEDKLLSKNTR